MLNGKVPLDLFHAKLLFFGIALLVLFACNTSSDSLEKTGVMGGSASMSEPVDIPKNALDTLISQAKEVSKMAYNPYSKFNVGAAIMTNDGTVFTGCNVENASYGLTICAERNTIFHMVAQGHRNFHTLVIYTPTPTPAAPCGACRQVINEFAPDARVISVCDGPEMIDFKLSDLLPDAFGPQNLD